MSSRRLVLPSRRRSSLAESLPLWLSSSLHFTFPSATLSYVLPAHIHAHDRRQEGSVVTAEQPTSVGGQLITTAASPTLPTQVAGLDVGAILSSIGTDQAALASYVLVSLFYLHGLHGGPKTASSHSAPSCRPSPCVDRASAIAASYLSGGGQGLEGLVGSATALASLLPTGLVQR